MYHNSVAADPKIPTSLRDSSCEFRGVLEGAWQLPELRAWAFCFVTMVTDLVPVSRFLYAVLGTRLMVME